ncbi:PSD1 and planctomycete cytochrome C domain-containing protein [Neorhodopirellula pilleata]|uniref:Planctomycete cytochrome C n=1 Tax=Neorhodopirellula pilleata TaxID=2714738 RepID=A0A5C6A7J5_9BACT|nr:PSD1 and planctomycete cytochrome C domain-containing protein [Neorhodopirellula pilleata]TWT95489.1 Planctomycete cytochrome C [Neorhodopirellula pilleata]
MIHKLTFDDIDSAETMTIRSVNVRRCLFFGVLSFFAWSISLVVSSGTLAADDSTPNQSDAGLQFFESKVRPVLVEHCYPCHSAEAGAAEGNLRLDTQAGMRTGGDRGPVLIAGDPSNSWLIRSIGHHDPDLKMPPKQERLPDSVIAELKKWIEIGAPDPRIGEPSEQSAWERSDDDFWAYQKPRPVGAPNIHANDWPKQPLDCFVLARLETHDQSPSPDAPPHELLRRLYFDLVGLPPSPERLLAFTESVKKNGLDRALAREVDRLLATPQFGERWGRHWLDVARFAESSGTEANISFPYAWRYRDYVIDCFNEDVPFDRFITEQLAGDQLPFDNAAERARLLIATGFLAVGPKNLDATDEEQFRADVVDEQIDTVTRALLGNSVACARCHDHKFDPFTMKDYYALAGIFASTQTFFGTAVSPANRIGGDPLRLPDVIGQTILHDSIPPERVETLTRQLAALRAEKADMDAAQKAMFSGKQPEKMFTLRDALRVFWQSGGIEGQLEKVSDSGEALPLAMGVLDAETAADAPLHERGDVKRLGPTIPRAVPQVLQSHTQTYAIPHDQSGRLQMARWLADPDHPLVSRVIVNRVWKHLFGTGLVATVDNFGVTGEPPSHPELLDTLSVQFVENGWSIKQLVRGLVLSRTYRQSSTFREAAFEQDPENRSLWRMPKRRLEAEYIRDAMLAVSGELDPTRPDGSLVGRVIGDKPISLIGLDKRLPADLDGSLQRSVYLPVIRDRLPDVLDLFDFAEPSLVTGNRETTNVPIQALYLLNSPFLEQRSEGFAKRLFSEPGSVKQRIEKAFQLCFSRAPTPDETERSIAYLQSDESNTNDADEIVPDKWRTFCQALLCTGEFRNLD